MSRPIPRDRESTQFLDLIDTLLDTYRPEGVLIWLNSGNRNFGGYSPRRLIAEGNWQQVLDEADRLAVGGK